MSRKKIVIIVSIIIIILIGLGLFLYYKINSKSDKSSLNNDSKIE